MDLKTNIWGVIDLTKDPSFLKETCLLIVYYWEKLILIRLNSTEDQICHNRSSIHIVYKKKKKKGGWHYLLLFTRMRISNIIYILQYLCIFEVFMFCVHLYLCNRIYFFINISSILQNEVLLLLCNLFQPNMINSFISSIQSLYVRLKWRNKIVCFKTVWYKHIVILV